ncbi:hypothetical protein MLD38_014762 [Melastoma candidum]|uniref:Uncharacterized protein n=1 Tax=Melastoma candidum TaxID=119954 RepID=A0ACB9RED9_9MYRT|nr:hypothetical protein MLD38_014762 [Melastoma candidum]
MGGRSGSPLVLLFFAASFFLMLPGSNLPSSSRAFLPVFVESKCLLVRWVLVLEMGAVDPMLAVHFPCSPWACHPFAFMALWILDAR